MALSDSQRQLLVRCEITNRDGDPGVRYVEHSLFRLWQYMMANKHGLVVHGLPRGVPLAQLPPAAQRREQ